MEKPRSRVKITTTIQDEDKTFLQEYNIEYASVINIGMFHARKIVNDILNSLKQKGIITSPGDGYMEIIHKVVNKVLKDMGWFEILKDVGAISNDEEK